MSPRLDPIPHRIRPSRRVAALQLELPPLRTELGGSLRPDDVRRYMVEAMVGAMLSDGVVADRELVTLRSIMNEHELFSALSDRAARQLVEIGIDAVQFAGGAEERVEEIAVNLPSRGQRLAAFAMACEVVSADEIVAHQEVAYLDKLRTTLVISRNEAGVLMDAAQAGRGLATLELITAGLARMVSPVVRMQLLRRLSVRALRPGYGVEIEQLVARLPDTQRYTGLVAGALAMAEMVARSYTCEEAELGELATLVACPEDRYWLTTYAMAADALRGCSSWYDIEFFCALRVAFSLPSATMRRAEAHARLLLRCESRSG